VPDNDNETAQGAIFSHGPAGSTDGVTSIHGAEPHNNNKPHKLFCSFCGFHFSAHRLRFTTAYSLTECVDEWRLHY